MYLVFDVGGTFVKYAWMSMDGNIQEKGKYPTPTKEGESVPEFVESLGRKGYKNLTFLNNRGLICYCNTLLH